MKFVTSLAAMLVLCMCGAAFASTDASSGVSVADMIAEKNAAISGVHNPVPQVGGEDISTAALIPVLPYSDGGNTCGYLNDYDEICPYSGSTSPDVVYAYMPGANAALDIELCTSLYDTKVYVYENNEFTLVACNDDDCGDDGFKSQLVGVPVTTGNTYYIVVDGYGGDCGDYSLNVTENVPCVIECPPGSFAEGEVDCYDDYEDNYNGGCNSTPNVFTLIPCNPTGAVTVCGTYGGFFHSPSGFNYRDTDWYELDVEGSTTGFTWTVEGGYETLCGYLDPICPAFAFVESAVVGPCDVATFNIPPGLWYLFVATSGFGSGVGIDCPGDYVMTLDGYACGPVAVQEASWGEIKADYR